MAIFRCTAKMKWMTNEMIKCVMGVYSSFQPKLSVFYAERMLT